MVPQLSIGCEGSVQDRQVQAGFGLQPQQVWESWEREVGG